MTIDELKRALVEVQNHCANYLLPECCGCPFADPDGFCMMTGLPEYWEVDEWKEDEQDENA